MAKVDGSGVVSGLAPGSATIVVTSGGVSGSGTVVVYAPTVSSLVLKPSVDTLLTDQHVTLFPTTWDQRGLLIREPLSIAWSSSDPSVADVDVAGKITAVSSGSSTITATIGAVRATATVIVQLGPTPAMIDGDWTMTLSPSPSCRDRMPAIARERAAWITMKHTPIRNGV